MASNALRKVLSLELEEKILNGGSLIALIGVFLPWIGGEWLGGETLSYSGLGFYTSFLGVGVLLLHLFVLLVTFVPLAGGPVIVRKRNKESARFLASLGATILTVSMWTVLLKFTFEFSRLEIHFGLYTTLIAGLVSALYTFLRFQEQRKAQVKELFHHPDSYEYEQPKSDPLLENNPPPPPPPPPPPEPEEHRPYR